MVHLFTSTATKFAVTVSQAAYMFNVFLLPKLELALRYVHGATGTVTAWLDTLDRILIGCIKHLCGASLRLSHSIVALCSGVILSSWLEATSKVSELFIRLNSHDPRWAGLGRLMMRHSFPADMQAGSAACSVEGGQDVRMLRPVRLALDTLQWSMHLRPMLRSSRAVDVDSNVDHPLFAGPGACHQPLRSDQHVTLPCRPAQQLALTHNVWSGWGEAVAAPSVVLHMYTDGSYVKPDSVAVAPRAAGPAMAPPAPSSSSWAVVLLDAWLEQNHASLPVDEQLLTPAHVAGATVFGSATSDACTQGVYAAELQAIARALAMVPLSAPVHIHTDSQASIKAIASYMRQTNERKRLRMSCRPLLQLIHHLISSRDACHNTTTQLSHVRAHTMNSDIDSVGNRLADYQANVTRARPNRPSPHHVQPLPIHQCEHYLHIKDEHGQTLIEDVRRSALKRVRALAVTRWRAKSLVEGQYFFGPAAAALIQLGRVVLGHASADAQAAMMLIVTNSIQYYWPPGRGAALQQLTCSDVCDHKLSLQHLATCTVSARCVNFRANLQQSIVDMLEQYQPATTVWLHRHRRSPLTELLLGLFPMSSCGIATVYGASDGHARRDFHQTTNMCGMYTGAQMTAAIKTLGFERTAKGQTSMQQLRLMCIEHIQLEYTSQKQIAMAQAPP